MATVADSRSLGIREELWDRTSEIAVLSYAMDNPRTLQGEWASRLGPEDFADLDTRATFEAILKLTSQGFAPMPFNLVPVLKDMAYAEIAEMPDFFKLEEWRLAAVFAPEAEAHAQRLIKLSEARMLKGTLEDSMRIISSQQALDQPVGWMTLALQAKLNQLVPAVQDSDEFTAEELEALEDFGDPFLVEGVLQDAGVNLLWGRGGEGKTLAALDLALKVCTTGSAFGGVVSRSGGVLYLGADVDKRTMKDRLRRMKKALGLETLPGFKYVRAPLDFAEPATFQYILHKAQEVGRQHPEGRCALIVVDSWASYLYHLDENSNSDVIGVMNQLRLLAEKTGAGILVIHHVNKNDLATGTNRGRGASAMPNHSDVVLELGYRGGSKIMSHSKTRNCTPMPPMVFEILAEDGGLAVNYVEATGADIGEVMVEICAEAMAAFVRGYPNEVLSKRAVLEAVSENGHYSGRSKERAWADLKLVPNLTVGKMGKSATVVYRPPNE